MLIVDVSINQNQSLGFAVKRLQHAMRKKMDARLGAIGLTLPQYTALALLSASPNMSNAELARRSFLAAPTMLRIIDNLVESGLVDRADITDRSRALSLTPAGNQALTRAAELVQDIENILRGALDSPDQAGPARDWLNRATEALEATDD